MIISDVSDHFEKLRIDAANYDLDWLVYSAQWDSGNQSAEELLESFQNYHKDLCLNAWKDTEFTGYSGLLIPQKYEAHLLFLENCFKDAEALAHGRGCMLYSEHLKERLNSFFALCKKDLAGEASHYFVYEGEWTDEFSIRIDSGFCILLMNEKAKTALFIFAEAMAG